jgi:hypothetical protein
LELETTIPKGATSLFTGQEQNDEKSLIKRELLLGHLKQFLPKFWGTLNVGSPPTGSPTTISNIETQNNVNEVVDDDEKGFTKPAPSLVTSVDCLTEVSKPTLSQTVHLIFTTFSYGGSVSSCQT